MPILSARYPGLASYPGSAAVLALPDGDERNGVLSALALICQELRAARADYAHESFCLVVLLLSRSLRRLAVRYGADSGELFLALLVAIDARAASLGLAVWRQLWNDRRSKAAKAVHEPLSDLLSVATEEHDLLQERRLWEALQALPPKEQELVLRAWVEDEPRESLADWWGCSHEAMRTRLKDLKKKLQKILQEAPHTLP